MNKKTICFDVDGVLANCAQRVIQRLNETLDTAFVVEDVTGYSISQALGVPPKLIWDIMGTKGFVSSLATYEDALKHVRKVRENYNVLFVTAPLPSSPHWGPERIDWLLDRGFAHSPQEVILTARKERITVGDLLIDDRMDNLLPWCATRRMPGFLWPAHHNMCLPQVPLDHLWYVARDRPWEHLHECIEQALS